MTTIIKGMMGLGDNIYSRAFIKNYPGAYLYTPWPELFKDLNLKFLRPSTQLRTQLKNMRLNRYWSNNTPTGRTISVRYGALPIVSGLRACFRSEPQAFDLPDYGPPLVSGSYILIRPVTVRSEWRADSRNPNPEYVAEAARQARALGYKVVSVADLEKGKEWAESPMPYADIEFHDGQLNISQLMALTKGACAVIGGIGWIVPASISANVPALIFCGGQGGFNAPSQISAPEMDLSKITFLVPDNFCNCRKSNHNCDKRIKDHESLIARWFEKLPSLGGGIRDGLAPKTAYYVF